MSNIQINRLTNANIYMDGTNLLGRAEEIQLPQIKHKMADHKALGMVGSAEFFAGIDKLESKIKWNALYPEVLKKLQIRLKQFKYKLEPHLKHTTIWAH